MPQQTRPRTNASTSMQPAGDDHVVLTVYATRRQVADLAWQLRRINNSPPHSAISTKSGSDELFSAVVRTVAAEMEMVEILGRYPG